MKSSLRKGDHVTGNDVSSEGGLQFQMDLPWAFRSTM